MGSPKIPPPPKPPAPSPGPAAAFKDETMRRGARNNRTGLKVSLGNQKGVGANTPGGSY